MNRQNPQALQDEPFILSEEALKSVEYLDYDTSENLALLTQALRLQSEPVETAKETDVSRRVVFRDITVQTIYPANTSRKRRNSSDATDTLNVESLEFIPLDLSDDPDLQQQGSSYDDPNNTATESSPLYPALIPVFDNDGHNTSTARPSRPSYRQRRTKVKRGSVPRLVRSYKSLTRKSLKDRIRHLAEDESLHDEEMLSLERASSLISDEEKENYEPTSIRTRLILSSSNQSTKERPSQESVASPSSPETYHHENRHESYDSTGVLCDRSFLGINSSDEDGYSSFDSPKRDTHAPFVPEADGFQFTGVDIQYPVKATSHLRVKRSVI